MATLFAAIGTKPDQDVAAALDAFAHAMFDPCRRHGILEEPGEIMFRGVCCVETRINVRNDGAVAVIDVSGNVDLNTSSKLRVALHELLATGRVHFLVNFLDTTYLDSTALSILTSVRNQVLGAGGMLGLVFNQPQIDRMLTITGLKDVFPTFVSQAEALAVARTWVKVGPERRSSPTLFR